MPPLPRLLGSMDKIGMTMAAAFWGAFSCVKASGEVLLSRWP